MPQNNTRHRIKTLANYSEIAKRAYILYRSMVSRRDKDDGYVIYEKQFERMEHAFGVSIDGSPLGRFLKENINKAVQKEEILRLIETSGYQEHKDEILKLCEKRWFHRFADMNFSPKEPDPESERWRLMFALFDEILATTNKAGASLEMISEHEEGYYQWQMFWHRYHSSEEAKEIYLKPTSLVKQWAKDNGVGFADMIAPIERARNDPHPNNKGYEIKAESIYRHIKSKYANQIERHRRDDSGNK